MATASASTALARIDGLPSAPLARTEDLAKTWEQLRGKANLISPVASVDAIPALHGISLRAVVIDSNTDQYGNGAEVYRDSRFCGLDEVALGGVALQKIAAAAGVQIVSTVRMDDRSEPYYCAMELTLGIRDFDGTWRQVTKSKEIDLREGAPEAMKPEKDNNNRKTGKLVALDPSALADKRRHIQSLAETKAFYRGLRTLLNLKQKYSKRELERPFVVPKLVPALDPSDPDQKKALIEMAIGTNQRLYAPRPSEARELKDVTPAPALPPAGTPPPPRNPVPPPPVGATRDDDEEVNEADLGDDDVSFDTPAADPIVCSCPCGHQVEVTAEQADLTREKLGTVRCRPCYPGMPFDFGAHRDVRGELQIPGKPGLTVEQLRQAVDKAKKDGRK